MPPRFVSKYPRVRAIFEFFRSAPLESNVAEPVWVTRPSQDSRHNRNGTLAMYSTMDGPFQTLYQVPERANRVQLGVIGFGRRID